LGKSQGSGWGSRLEPQSPATSSTFRNREAEGASEALFEAKDEAFSFIYPAVAAFFDPLSWIGFFPDFLLNTTPLSDVFLLHIFGITEIIIAIWLLVGRNVRTPSIIAATYLAAIIIFNFPLMDIVFRDISILAMALALIVLEHKDIPQPPAM